MTLCLILLTPVFVLCGAFGVVGIIDVIGQIRADQITRKDS